MGYLQILDTEEDVDAAKDGFMHNQEGPGKEKLLRQINREFEWLRNILEEDETLKP